MRQKTLSKWLLTGGYNSSAPEAVELRSNLAKGSKNILKSGTGKNVAFKGLGNLPHAGSQVLMPVSDTFAGLGNFAQVGSNGSVERVLATLLFVGSGLLHYDGVSLGANASSVLQLKLLQNGIWSATTYQAGLSQPDSPVITAKEPSIGFTGKLKAGTYSLRIYKIRTATGAKSIASEISNIAQVVETNGVGQSLRVSFPPIGGNGADAWGIAVSPRNFASTGGHYLYKEILESDLTTIDGVPRSYEIEYSDGDLVGRKLAPIDSFPPPAATFIGLLGDSAFLDGCYGDLVTGANGSTIAQSLPFRFEEYPPDWLLFPPEPPVALLRGGNGYYYRLGKNSMGVISWVGGEPPLAYQTIWATTGVNYPHNVVIAEGGRLYAKTGTGTLARIGAGNQPETAWANPIADEAATWSDAKTVLGWDENSKNLLVCHEKLIYPFNTSLEDWGAPCDVSGTVSGDIVSAVTYRGSCYLTAKDAVNSLLKMYNFNAGTGSVMEVRTDWRDTDGRDMLRYLTVEMRADNLSNVNIKVYANDNLSSPLLDLSVPPANTGKAHLEAFRGAVKNLRSFCVHLSQTSAGGDAGFEMVEAAGVPYNFR